MPTLEDLLREGVERRTPPVDDGLFTLLARRRARRSVVRRVQAGALTVAVLAATVTGFVALSDIFARDRGAGPATQLPGNGVVVFSNEGSDGRYHLFSMSADGTGARQITDFATDDTAPAVSPDGRTIAFVHTLESGVAVVGSIPIDGGIVMWLTDPALGATDPAWSPGGGEIAFTGSDEGTRRIFVMSANGSNVRVVSPLDLPFAGDPSWSPGGKRIAFEAEESADALFDIWSVDPGGGSVRNMTDTPDRSEAWPAWSPAGQRIAFVRGTDDSDDPATNQIIVRSLADGSETPLTDGTTTDESLAWSPDGRLLAFDRTDGRALEVYVARVADGSITRLTTDGGVDPAWQPIPDGAVSTTPQPAPRGRDIGVGFPVCDVSRTRGDFNGDGQVDTAFYATKLSDAGPCAPNDAFNVVALDLDADRLADISFGPLEPCPAVCAAFDATDLDGDGADELVVTSYFSIMDYYFFALRPNAGGDPQIEPVLVADPGHEPAGIIGGEPLRIDAGGDEGYGSSIRCEGYPSAPVVVWSWSLGVIDGAAPTEVHESRIQLQSDGLFHVVGSNDYTVPAGQPTGIDRTTAPACGIDWHPSP